MKRRSSPSSARSCSRRARLACGPAPTTRCSPRGTGSRSPACSRRGARPAHAPALALALRVAAFLRDRMISGGTIKRVHHEGTTKDLEGTLDDYAFCADAFLELAEATGDRTWWDLGAKLAATIRTRFCEQPDGVVVFYLSPPARRCSSIAPSRITTARFPPAPRSRRRRCLRLGLVAGDADALALAETLPRAAPDRHHRRQRVGDLGAGRRARSLSPREGASSSPPVRVATSCSPPRAASTRRRCASPGRGRSRRSSTRRTRQATARARSCARARRARRRPTIRQSCVSRLLSATIGPRGSRRFAFLSPVRRARDRDAGVADEGDWHTTDIEAARVLVRLDVMSAVAAVLSAAPGFLQSAPSCTTR